ncbi:phosphoribosylaminoimidazole-succinocarboxamide synthase [Methylohalomonas lacus]|uniref:Phosphoribosylaminoimidazole-succinocarboxamide synthase n=1 Tax=Methylohalomonas lacus TaxID=398773 RepID=A0AAE3L4L3_9GAMM|nr:phosphoribosylaminoimidazolesuccinocarboxamide synthase [Methylohalomonas lacus]MCS3904028.1 phosphoribosylaminoimidazole-succinocarboxamide synthase [Methylohalomonas lacus]
MHSPDRPLYRSEIRDLPLLSQGKVRDIYAVGDDHLLIVTSDRLSAFDVILPDPIPDKGRVLNRVANFWFARTAGRIRNHLADIPLADVVPDAAERAPLEGRSVVVRRCQALPVEAVARGYIIGSGWKDYQGSGRICGIPLPAGLRQAEQLPEPIFTPATKAEVGDHDENISFEQMADRIGKELAERIREQTLAIYSEAAAYAAERGIIIADTKLEFGLDDDGELILIDEVLTPDSSRFWPADEYQVGSSPPSFDKQFVRDYLESLDWDKKPPAPRLPTEIIDKTAAKYREAETRLTGERG